jgi:signal transduction histidine kinase
VTDADHQQRVIVLAPRKRDARLSQIILARAGMACTVCGTMESLCDELADAAGAVVLTEEALASEHFSRLITILNQQPVWSDLPLILLMPGGANSPVLERMLAQLGNVLILDRPVRLQTLISVLRSALLARKRQYQIRAHLVEQQQAEEALRYANTTLEQQVVERTRELRVTNTSLQDEIQERIQLEHARGQLLRQLVTAQEQEHRRIARELHDQMGQHVTALHLGLRMLKDLSAGRPTTLASLEQLSEIVTTLGQEAHALALELRPTALDDLGLDVALGQHIAQWRARTRITVDFHSTTLEQQRLPPAIETTIYRVVQEALTNVAKHAGAMHVSVIVEYHTNRVHAIVEDNGRGFDQDILREPIGTREGLGLQGMRERVAQVGGTLMIESVHSHGTSLFVRIPLGRHPANQSLDDWHSSCVGCSLLPHDPTEFRKIADHKCIYGILFATLARQFMRLPRSPVIGAYVIRTCVDAVI